MKTSSKLKVIELFAGVGGFRLGLEGLGPKHLSSTSGYKKPLKNKIPFHIKYSNQYEPLKKKQHANDIYSKRFSKIKDSTHYEKDINYLLTEEKKGELKIKCDLLVGGFPCQNYSVASLLRDAKGLIGEKGILWWEIERILNKLKDQDKAPDYLLLENVNKLLISPTKRPGEPDNAGRDFAIILSSLARLDYNVEWRMINAADYGFPQKRRRVFIFGFKRTSKISKILKDYSLEEILFHHGIIAKPFPCKSKKNTKELPFERVISKDPEDYVKNYSDGRFKSAGVMINGKLFQDDVIADYNKGFKNLKSILVSKSKVPEEFYVRDKETIKKWEIEKGPQTKTRIPKKGKEYEWKVGRMNFPDPLDQPSRTIVTSEGSKSPSRIHHIIQDKDGDYRRLTPIELEKLNMFPEDFTRLDGVTDTMRAFLMGNALVIGVVEKIGTNLSKMIHDSI
jgi:DNA (cytosine-5)-methyltransferase 1